MKKIFGAKDAGRIQQIKHSLGKRNNSDGMFGHPVESQPPQAKGQEIASPGLR